MKKMMNKKTLAMCVAAAALFTLPLTASAQLDKLVVKDPVGTEVFKVDDTGTITGAKLGMGTSTPRAPFHLQLPSKDTGLPTNPGTALVTPATAGMVSGTETSMVFDMTVASEIPGRRGSIRGIKSRGTMEAPTAPIENDIVATIMGGVWDGNIVQNTAEVGFYVDGPVSSGVAPQRISFTTSPLASTNKVERLAIKSDGSIIMNSLAGTYTGGSAYVCVDDAGVIFASEAACP